mmetsp:Transcript_33223/g.98911  ORF Transcript_33223/g.98911 Transcript_33223/m.98911 type:complete len:243 (-) Transcript_33223:17-745(-)
MGTSRTACYLSTAAATQLSTSRTVTRNYAGQSFPGSKSAWRASVSPCRGRCRPPGSGGSPRSGRCRSGSSGPARSSSGSRHASSPGAASTASAYAFGTPAAALTTWRSRRPHRCSTWWMPSESASVRRRRASRRQSTWQWVRSACFPETPRRVWVWTRSRPSTCMAWRSRPRALAASGWIHKDRPLQRRRCTSLLSRRRRTRNAWPARASSAPPAALTATACRTPRVGASSGVSAYWVHEVV